MPSLPKATVALSRFRMTRPAHELPQAQALDWLVRAHTAAATVIESLDPAARRAFRDQMARVVARVACDPSRIGARGHVLPDFSQPGFDDARLYDLDRHPHGRGTAERMRFYATAVGSYFEETFAEVDEAPSDIIHVSCTGYVAPSAAQRLVASRGWGDATRVTHAYHMGCYAAFPALRMAGGFLESPSPARSPASPRVEIVHTELCTLHLDPGNHALDQLVVQSLFADGMIRYAVRPVGPTDEPSLAVLALNEVIVPDSADSMGWVVGDQGLTMTLSRDVPERIGGALQSFVNDLFTRAGLDRARDQARTVFAIHPGGPKIIDAVRDRLELTEPQVSHGRKVLYDYGNMSSATLPHVWMRVLGDDAILPGTPVLSLAFGPGLTIAGSVFEKR